MQLLVGSANGGNLKKYDAASGTDLGDFCTGGPGYGGYSYPEFGPNNELYVKLYSYSGLIDSYNGATGTHDHNLWNTSEGFNFAFNKGGELLNFDWQPKLNRYDTISGTLLGNLIPYSNVNNHPGTIRYRANTDELYVLYFYGIYPNNQIAILRFNASTGAYIADFIPATNTFLSSNFCYDFIFGKDGNVYASRYISNDVIKIDGTTGNLISVFASGSGLTGPWGLAFGPDANLYVASTDQNSVYRFNGHTGNFIDVFAKNTYNVATYITFTPAPKDHCHWLLIKTILWIFICFKGEIKFPKFGTEIPPDPHNRQWDVIAHHFWKHLSKEEQDAFTAFAIHRMSSLLHNKNEAKEIQEEVVKIIGEKYEVLHMLIQQHTQKEN